MGARVDEATRVPGMLWLLGLQTLFLEELYCHAGRPVKGEGFWAEDVGDGNNGRSRPLHLAL